jgi:hypothetical protein
MKFEPARHQDIPGFGSLERCSREKPRSGHAGVMQSRLQANDFRLHHTLGPGRLRGRMAVRPGSRPYGMRMRDTEIRSRPSQLQVMVAQDTCTLHRSALGASKQQIRPNGPDG